MFALLCLPSDSDSTLSLSRKPLISFMTDDTTPGPAPLPSPLAWLAMALLLALMVVVGSNQKPPELCGVLCVWCVCHHHPPLHSCSFLDEQREGRLTPPNCYGELMIGVDGAVVDDEGLW